MDHSWLSLDWAENCWSIRDCCSVKPWNWGAARVWGVVGTTAATGVAGVTFDELIELVDLSSGGGE